MESSFLATLPDLQDLEVGELPAGPVVIDVCHRGEKLEMECEPELGWDMLKMQIFTLLESLKVVDPPTLDGWTEIDLLPKQAQLRDA